MDGIILETERLLLRSWRDADREPLARILGDPVVRRFYPRVATPEEVERSIDEGLEKARVNGFHYGAAELKADGRMIGLLGLAVLSDTIRDRIAGRPRVEIGWQFDKAIWGQGLAPEGARAWLDHAAGIGLDEVIAYTAEINTPSRRVMEKIGMLRDPADDFENPNVPEDSPLRPHVVYRWRG